MAQSYDRRINLYINIDGKQVNNNVKSIRGEMSKLINQQAQMTIGSEEYIRQTKKIQYLRGIINQHNQDLTTTKGALGGLQDKLSQMPGAFGSMAAGIISVGKASVAFFLTPVGAIIGIVAAIVMGVKALITNSVEFGKAASSLSAITGAVGKDLDFLKKKAREISKETTQSATEILNAFQTIGGAMPELLKNGPLLAEVTRNAVILSESTGGKLAVTDAAKAAASALNQFNIPLTESTRAVNVLAAGSLEGAAEVDNITEAMKNIGPVANGANLSLENTVAAIELVAEKGILGAEAGTKLRGVILKLQGESLGYASGQFNLKDAIDEANKAMDAQGSSMERDAYLVNLFGVENVTVGRIVLENVDKYVKLTAAVTDTNAAYDQAKVQMNNLDGSNKKFSGAWKNMMLSIEDGNGMLARSWKAIVDGATWLINGMTDYFENLGASIRAVGIVFGNFYQQTKTPVAALGRLLKAVFTMDLTEMAPALAAFKSSLADIGKDGSLELSRIAREQLKIGQASKEATAQLKQQKKEQEELAKAALLKGDSSVTTTDTSSAKAATDAIELAYKQQTLALKQKYANEETLKKEYAARMLAAEIAYMQTKLQITTDEGGRLDLQSQLIDKQIAYTAALKEAVPEIINTDNAIGKLNSRLLEEAKLMVFVAAKQAEAANATEEMKAKQESLAKMYQGTIEGISSGIYELASGSEDALKTMAKNLLIFALEQLKIQAEIAIAGVTIQGLASLNPAQMLVAAVKIAAIEAVFAGLEGLVNKSFSSKKEKAQGRAFGGFMQGEQTYTVAEKGKEWISPNWMLNNPVTGPMIAGLESWRRNPIKLTQGAIEATQWAVKSPKFKNINSTDNSDTTGEITKPYADPDLKRILEENTKAMLMNSQATALLIKKGVQFPIYTFKKRYEEISDLLDQPGMEGFKK